MKSSNGKRGTVCFKTMVSIHIFPSSQKSCIDPGVLNILVKNHLIFLTAFWSQQVIIWYGYLFPAHSHDPWAKEGTFSRYICSPVRAGQGSQLFLLCFPTQVRQACPRARLSRGPLHSQSCSMARSEKPRAVSAPKALQRHQTWEQIRFGETKWHTSALIFQG